MPKKNATLKNTETEFADNRTTEDACKSITQVHFVIIISTAYFYMPDISVRFAIFLYRFQFLSF